MPIKKYACLNLSINEIEGEIWKDIPQFKGLYSLSNYGRIKKVKSAEERANKKNYKAEERIVKPQMQRYLSVDGKRESLRLVTRIGNKEIYKQIPVARFVYYLFVKKFDLKKPHIFIRFINDDSLDIRPDNLFFSNPKEASIYSYSKGLRIQKMYGKEAIPITQYSLEGKKLKVFSSVNEASKAMGVVSAQLSAAINKENGYSAGYIWRKGDMKANKTTVDGSVKKIAASRKFNTTIISKYDSAGRKVKEYENIKAAAIATKSSSIQLKKVVTGIEFFCKGFHYKLGKGPKKINIKTVLKAKADRRRKGINIPITQYDLDGNFIRNYATIADAAKRMKLQIRYLHEALKNDKVRSSGGFIWKFTNPTK
jgi:hypothetical protein